MVDSLDEESEEEDQRTFGRMVLTGKSSGLSRYTTEVKYFINCRQRGEMLSDRGTRIWQRLGDSGVLETPLILQSLQRCN